MRTAYASILPFISINSFTELIKVCKYIQFVVYLFPETSSHNITMNNPDFAICWELLGISYVIFNNDYS